MSLKPCAVKGAKMLESAHQSAAYDHSALNHVEQREMLILEHLPQIKYIAQRISTKLPSHVELNDLVGAGVLGLLDAIEKFDPSRGVKFKTYAELRIKGRFSTASETWTGLPARSGRRAKTWRKCTANLSSDWAAPRQTKRSATRWISRSRSTTS